MTKLVEQIKQGADQAWESLTEGWRALSARASGALTRFRPAAESAPPASWPGTGLESFNSWAFLAADVVDADDKLVVRIEAPGMRREDFHVELDAGVLSVWGEKRFDGEARQGRYTIAQCAYGSFRRDVVLPAAVKADHTQATYRDGVLRIELPKADGARVRRIAVQGG